MKEIESLEMSESKKHQRSHWLAYYKWHEIIYP